MSHSSDLSWITNDFLRLYLNYVDQTESPRLMHLWSAIACASACMGRHTWLDTGIGKLYGNMYVLLVGPPGTRKSSAINFSKKLVKKGTRIKFAPKDTSGKKQGLIAAMAGESDIEQNDDLTTLSNADIMAQMAALSDFEITVNAADRHCMFICASEFGSFIGQNNLELVRFLVEMWDGEDYPYQLKNETSFLRDPLLALVGGTTAADMATLLPPEAIGQGFMSRIVLVYASKKDKIVPPSKMRLDRSIEQKLVDSFTWIERTLNGPMTLSPEAHRYSDRLYVHSPQINDSRFIFYSERRHTHLLKLSMSLAALRRSTVVEKDDLEQADILLESVEEVMPEALGEFGLSPLALSKQKIMEFIRHAREPITQGVLWAVMQRDMKQIDFRNCINDLINARKITEVPTDFGVGYVYRDPIFEVVDLLTETEEQVNETGNHQGHRSNGDGRKAGRQGHARNQSAVAISDNELRDLLAQRVHEESR